MGQWDDLMKLLVGANPQQFVSLLLPDAQFKQELDKELKVRTIIADLLYVIMRNGKEVVLHVEFQRYRDKNMGERLWEYNVLTTVLYRRPVVTFAIYLVEEDEIVKSPYEKKLTDDEAIHIFYFRNIELWKMSAEVLKQPGLEGMLPLMPLTQDGKRPERIDEMIFGLQAAKKDDLLPLGYTIAALVFDTEQDKEWLKRRFAMLQERLEESWAYKEIMEKGWAQGLERGQLLALRPILTRLVQKHFSELTSLAAQRAEEIQNPALLQTMIDSLLSVSTTEEARRILIGMGKGTDTPS